MWSNPFYFPNGCSCWQLCMMCQSMQRMSSAVHPTRTLSRDLRLSCRKLHRPPPEFDIDCVLMHALDGCSPYNHHVNVHTCTHACMRSTAEVPCRVDVHARACHRESVRICMHAGFVRPRHACAFTIYPRGVPNVHSVVRPVHPEYPVVLQGHSRCEYVVNRVRGTRGCEHVHDEDDQMNHCSLAVIGIRHRYHKIQEFEK
jgi:hypothetical protein